MNSHACARRGRCRFPETDCARQGQSRFSPDAVGNFPQGSSPCLLAWSIASGMFASVPPLLANAGYAIRDQVPWPLKAMRSFRGTCRNPASPGLATLHGFNLNVRQRHADRARNSNLAAQFAIRCDSINNTGSWGSSLTESIRTGVLVDELLLQDEQHNPSPRMLASDNGQAPQASHVRA